VITKILSFDWALFFFWIMATTLGWFLGGLVLTGLSFVISGFLIGIFQWAVLQGRIRNPWRWMIATTAGWTAGYLITLFGIPGLFELTNGGVIGLTTGLAQWLVLRREVNWAGWWIVFSIIGWTTGLTLIPGAMLSGTMAGILTGLALEILLRYPKLKRNIQTPDPVEI
jgi:F0F1-type ATP synthase membrane subunit c/vacuolar-type H+-ATPase subunit K